MALALQGPGLRARQPSSGLGRPAARATRATWLRSANSAAPAPSPSGAGHDRSSSSDGQRQGPSAPVELHARTTSHAHASSSGRGAAQQNTASTRESRPRQERAGQHRTDKARGLNRTAQGAGAQQRGSSTVSRPGNHSSSGSSRGSRKPHAELSEEQVLRRGSVQQVHALVASRGTELDHTAVAAAAERLVQLTKTGHLRASLEEGLDVASQLAQQAVRVAGAPGVPAQSLAATLWSLARVSQQRPQHQHWHRARHLASEEAWVLLVEAFLSANGDAGPLLPDEQGQGEQQEAGPGAAGRAPGGPASSGADHSSSGGGGSGSGSAFAGLTPAGLFASVAWAAATLRVHSPGLWATLSARMRAHSRSMSARMVGNCVWALASARCEVEEPTLDALAERLLQLQDEWNATDVSSLLLSTRTLNLGHAVLSEALAERAAALLPSMSGLQVVNTAQGLLCCGSWRKQTEAWEAIGRRVVRDTAAGADRPKDALHPGQVVATLQALVKAHARPLAATNPLSPAPALEPTPGGPDGWPGWDGSGPGAGSPPRSAERSGPAGLQRPQGTRKPAQQVEAGAVAGMVRGVLRRALPCVQRHAEEGHVSAGEASRAAWAYATAGFLADPSLGPPPAGQGEQEQATAQPLPEGPPRVLGCLAAADLGAPPSGAELRAREAGHPPAKASDAAGAAQQLAAQRQRRHSTMLAQQRHERELLAPLAAAPLFSALAACTRARIKEVTHVTAAVLLWAFARAGCFKAGDGRETLDALCGALGLRLTASANTGSLAMALWALAAAGGPPPALRAQLLPSLELCAYALLSRMHPSELVLCLGGLTSLGQRPEALLEAAAEWMLHRRVPGSLAVRRTHLREAAPITRLQLDELADLACACARAGFTDEALFNAVADRVAQVVAEGRSGQAQRQRRREEQRLHQHPDLRPQHARSVELRQRLHAGSVARLMWAFAERGLADTPFLQLLCTEARALLPSFEPRDTARCLWALATSAHWSQEADDVALGCLRLCVERTAHFSAPQLADVAWACAALSGEQPLLYSPQLAQWLAAQLCGEGGLAQEFGLADACRVVWALGVWRHHDPQLCARVPGLVLPAVRALAGSADAAAQSLSAEGAPAGASLAQLLQGLTTFGAYHRELYAAAARALEGHLYDLSAEEVAVLAWCYAATLHRAAGEDQQQQRQQQEEVGRALGDAPAQGAQPGARAVEAHVAVLHAASDALPELMGGGAAGPGALGRRELQLLWQALACCEAWAEARGEESPLWLPPDLEAAAVRSMAVPQKQSLRRMVTELAFAMQALGYEPAPRPQGQGQRPGQPGIGGRSSRAAWLAGAALSDPHVLLYRRAGPPGGPGAGAASSGSGSGSTAQLPRSHVHVVLALVAEAHHVQQSPRMLLEEHSTLVRLLRDQGWPVVRVAIAGWGSLGTSEERQAWLHGRLDTASAVRD